MIISLSALLDHSASFMVVPAQPRLIESSGRGAAKYGAAQHYIHYAFATL